MRKKRILFVGDAGCSTGFAKSTEHIGASLVQAGYDVACLAIGYRGDDGHGLPMRLFTCQPGGDVFGYGRLLWTIDEFGPDLVIIQNDPWNFKRYTQQIRQDEELRTLPIVGIAAVDGKNCRGVELNDCDAVVFWSDFALREAQLGGFEGEGHVIPLGVDLDIFTPLDRVASRVERGFPAVFPRGHKVEDAYIVGAVNRNQARKRLDLLMLYFAEWVQTKAIDNAYLFLHVAPTGDQGYDLLQLSEYLGIKDRLVTRTSPIFVGDPIDQLVKTYNCFDVAASTTQGEGFGLTSFEAMACGIPHIAPKWSALGDILGSALVSIDGGDSYMNPALMVPCSTVIATAHDVNSIGGIADRAQFVESLDMLHRSPETRANYAQAGRSFVKQERFRWEDIGRRHVELIGQILS